MARSPHVWPPEDVPGPHVRLTNADKVLYPATGTTKEEVFGYYTRIADVMLPHIADRPATRKRWPNGVEEASFFEKQLADSAPEWLNRREHRAQVRRHHVPDHRQPGGPGLDRSAGRAGSACAAVAVHTRQAWAGNPTRVRSRSRPGCADGANCRRGQRDPGHVERHRVNHLPGDQRQQGAASLRAGGAAAHVAGCTDSGQEGGAATRAGRPEPCHIDDDEKPSRRQGFRRLESEQRIEDDDRAVLAARPGSADGRGATDVGGTRRSRVAAPALRRGARARRQGRRSVGSAGRRHCAREERYSHRGQRPADEVPQHARSPRKPRNRCHFRCRRRATTTDS